MTSTQFRFICIHGHFYQPPRENPWLEAIEIQESAHPWHDWNQRIAEECYTPNTQARILDERGRISRITNNYEYLSFDFGPTLLVWLETHVPRTYEAIVQADLVSRKTRSGHGNAIAQAYNHLIMPLASERDKISQVVWGIEDFRRRFGRDPEGMWLPETAVDLESLNTLVQHGIRFTILAPSQARKFRSSPREKWQDNGSGSFDITRPYLCVLPGGRTISLFFYDGSISLAIAFQRLLDSGEHFKDRLLAAFPADGTKPRLLSVATDGESYGHHHRFGEMALAYTLKRLLEDPSVRLTNFAEFLANNPPSAEVEIVENSSWSCAHGVGRWSEDCGCHIENKPGWNQKWRAPLRHALDLVRDRVDPIYVRESTGLFKDPWAARNDYISVVLDRQAAVDRFLSNHTVHQPAPEERLLALNLLELQRHRMLMYTSCGWFFDDISGIESLQILKYAARVLQLAAPYDPALERDFLAELEPARSNKRPYPSGETLYLQRVKPQVADLAKVAAHAAISSVFEDYPIEGTFFCYEITVDDSTREVSGDRVLLVRRLSLESTITGERHEFVAAVLHLGGVDFRCSVREFSEVQDYEELKRDLIECCSRHSATELVRKLDRYFPGDYFILRDLFVEQRFRIIRSVTDKTYKEQAILFESFYNKNRDFAMWITEDDVPLPDTFLVAARFVVNRRFLRELEKLASGFFPDELASVVEEARFWRINPDMRSAEKLISGRVLEMVHDLEKDPEDDTIAQEIMRLLDLCEEFEIPTELSLAQIALFKLIRSMWSQGTNRFPAHFSELADRIGVRIGPD
jgi:alpha-amylase/alpha-mannosidase (GH57 family)